MKSFFFYSIYLRKEHHPKFRLPSAYIGRFECLDYLWTPVFKYQPLLCVLMLLKWIAMWTAVGSVRAGDHMANVWTDWHRHILNPQLSNLTHLDGQRHVMFLHFRPDVYPARIFSSVVIFLFQVLKMILTRDIDNYYHIHYNNFCLSVARQSLLGLGLLIIKASRWHSLTRHSVGLLSTSDQS